jgi:hypothetical protein
VAAEDEALEAVLAVDMGMFLDAAYAGCDR